MGLWLWIVVPLVAILIAFAVSNYCCLRMERKLFYRSAVAELMPEMHQQYEAAKGILDTFGERVAGEASAVGVLRSRLNSAALESGFVINGLSIEAPKGGMGGAAPCFRADVRGEGKLMSVIGIFDRLQKPTGLVVIESLRMGADQARADPLYQSQFVLRWSFLTN